MKKQLLIAAVAATMTSAAMADISISGAAKANFKVVDFDGSAANTNTISREMDIKIAGKNGDTSVVMNIANDSLGDAGLVTEDSYVATKLGDVAVKVGAWDNGNNALRASARTDAHLSASTTMGGLTVTYDGYGDAADDSVKVAADVSGVGVSYKKVATGEDISVSATVAGIKASYLALNRDGATADRSVIELSGDFGGVGIKVAQAEADTLATIEGDTWMGDYENASGAYDLTAGQDVTAIELSTSIAGNSVKFRNVDVDGVSGADMSFNKVIVTRPLANGTTFEATYTDLDDSVAANDSSTLDLELAVKF